MMWTCAMLTPSRRSRSLDAHLSWVIVARKSAMMADVWSFFVAGAMVGAVDAAIVRVT